MAPLPLESFARRKAPRGVLGNSGLDGLTSPSWISAALLECHCGILVEQRVGKACGRPGRSCGCYGRGSSRLMLHRLKGWTSPLLQWPAPSLGIILSSVLFTEN